MSKTPELTGAGMYRLEYLGKHGWWVGHRGIDMADVEAYIAGVNKEQRPARAINKVTGEIIGDVAPLCSLCEEAHTGPEGACLL